jgi:hypothetical protein
MTTLVFQALKDELSQEISYGLNERLHLGCVSIYLIVMNSPPGTFTVSMTGQNGLVFSKSFTSTDIKTALGTTDNFYHVFYPVIPTNNVQIGYGDYTITLTASGYASSDSSFIGWVQQHEDIQSSFSYVSSSDEANQLSMRIKSYKEGIL